MYVIAPVEISLPVKSANWLSVIPMRLMRYLGLSSAGCMDCIILNVQRSPFEFAPKFSQRTYSAATQEATRFVRRLTDDLVAYRHFRLPVNNLGRVDKSVLTWQYLESMLIKFYSSLRIRSTTRSTKTGKGTYIYGTSIIPDWRGPRTRESSM